MTTMTVTEYAATHSATRQAADKWRRKGLMVLVGERVDVEASDANMHARALGRFRCKAHGGRREAGVRGKVDRPGIAPPSPVKAHPWEGWTRRGNPHTIATTLREALAGGDQDEIDDAVDLVAYSVWEDHCTHAGWDRWPSDAAGPIAAELGLADREAEVREVLHRHVRTRLTSPTGLDLSEADLTDPRLEPR